jgi:hypothetical protein
VAATVLYVTNVEQLYAEVNNPENEAAVITLAPGTYVLSATNAAGVMRPNGGRLELQRDMSLRGAEGDAGLVQIDGSKLTAFSAAPYQGRTGVIRLGRGSNAVEWITVVGNANAAATIDTDLSDSYTAPANAARITIAHVVASGGTASGGLDIRNAGGDPAAVMSGRRLVAVITDNEFFGGVFGIRIANHVSITGGQIDVEMHGNIWHDNSQGCLVLDLNSSSSKIRIRSDGDRFEHNTIGCAVYGGRTTTLTSAAIDNAVTFDAHGSSFEHNTAGGLLVVGGDAVLLANSASDNTATVALWGCRVDEHQPYQVQAFGALMDAGSGVAGMNNHVTIELHGVSKQIEVLATASVPSDPAGTNSVTVVR